MNDNLIPHPLSLILLSGGFVQKSSDVKIVGLFLVCAALLVIWRVLPQSRSRLKTDRTMEKPSPTGVKPAEWKNYSEALVRKAQNQGKPVIVDFFADW